jgi:hypothetical protein
MPHLSRAAWIVFMAFLLVLTGAISAAANTTFDLTGIGVKPASQPEWTVDPNGGSATWMHCCDAGQWQSSYGFKAPTALEVGKAAPLMLSVSAASCQSGSGCNFAISVSGDGVPADRSVSVHADFNGSASDSKAVPINLPDSAAGLEAVHLTVDLGGGPDITYDYKHGCCPDPVELAPSTAFGTTATVDAPAPGGAAVATSPKLPASGAVTATVTGISKSDLAVIAAARNDCYTNFATSVLKGIDPKSARDTFSGEAVILALFEQDKLAACLGYVAAVQEILTEAANASAAAAGGCPLSRVKLSLSGSGANTRLGSFRVGSTRGGQQGLKVRCTLSGGRLTMSVAPPAHKSLRKILGSRLRIGLVRGSSDPAGGKLGITFRRG